MSSSASIWQSLLGAEFCQRFYVADGVRTRVLEAGTGEPLILLHGTGGHAESYVRNLADLSKDFRVIAVDMLGHGYTEGGPLDYSHDDFAAHLIGLMDVMGIDRASFSGESLGATVAAWLSILHPERVSKLVMSTGVFAHTTGAGARQYDDLVARTERLAGDLTMDNVRKRLEWLVHDPDSMPEEMVAVRHAIYSQPGMMENVVRIVRAVVTQHKGPYQGVDYMDTENMKRIPVPTMILWTRHNPGKSLDLAQNAAEGMAEVRFVVFDESAHWPQFEEPGRFNTVHRDFLGIGDGKAG